MRIAFVDLHDWDFHVGTVDRTPLKPTPQRAIWPAHWPADSTRCF